MATEKRLIDANEALRMINDSRTDNPYFNGKTAPVWEMAHDCAISCVIACHTVDAYTEEQVASIIQLSHQLNATNVELEKELAWLKSCLNCKVRKECPRHCGKVVHDCDHWEYGDSSVDAVEVVHGRWIGLLKPREVWKCRCDQCGCPQDYEHNYCPNCGAKMDGDGNERC